MSFLLAPLSLGFFSCNQNKTVVVDQILLSDGWKLQSSANINQGGEILSTPDAVTDSWYAATVPSTVMGVLTANGQYGDLLVGMNYKEADRTPFDVSWWYRTSFKTPCTKGQHVQLQFDGLSYRANIWFNGKQIGNKDEIYGAFCRFTFDVTELLQEENVLAVEVFRARDAEPNIGFVDWNPRPLDESMGLFRPVTVKVSGQVDMKNSWVRTKINKETLQEAWLTVETQLTNLSNQKVSGKLEGSIESLRFSIPVTLEAGEVKNVKISPEDVKGLHIKNPRLWWSRDMGSPELYDLELRFVTGNQVSDVEKVRFGIREVETFLLDDKYRYFTLNGKRVLIKSAGYTDDIFLRDTPESYETQVRYVCDMNMNSIRLEGVWGNDKSIFELCDAYGLLLMVGWSCQWEWVQYFFGPSSKFGCIITDHDKDLLVRYLKDQISWIRSHPSVICFSGGSDELLAPDLEQRYMDIWDELTQVPYFGTSANRMSAVTGLSGMKMEGPYEYVGPNYWFVDTIKGGNYGFNSETGIGAHVPVYESLLKMIPQDKLWSLNEYWDYHTTSSKMICTMEPTITAVDAMYGKPADLQSFLNNAYLMSMQSTQSMYEAFRVNYPAKATGIVQWMLNSAWPSVHWQLYDYYLIPVSSYYGVKRGCEPVQLVYNYKDNGIYFVNETASASGKLTAVIRGYDINSKLLFDEKREIVPQGSAAQSVFTIDNSTKNTFLFLSLFDEQGAEIAKNFYCLSSKPDVYDYEKDAKERGWFVTAISSHGDFKALANLPQAGLKIETEPLNACGQNGLSVTLENDSPTLALLVQLMLTDGQEPVTPVYWSDNYVSIPPGEKVILQCRYDCRKEINPKDLKVTGWNMAEQRISLSK